MCMESDMSEYAKRYGKGPAPMADNLSLELLTKAAVSKRSGVYVWMLDNHDVFAEVLSKAGNRPNWKAIAETFGNAGVMTSDGRVPSPEAARQTWWKVRKAVASRGAKTVAHVMDAPPQAASQEPVLLTMLRPHDETPDAQPDHRKPRLFRWGRG